MGAAAVLDTGQADVRDTDALDAVIPLAGIPRSMVARADQEPVELGRGLGFSALAGVAAIYALTVAIGMAAGTTVAIALLLAIWPALFAGPFFGGVVLLGRQLAQIDRERTSRSVPLDAVDAVDAEQGHRLAA